MRFTRKNPRQYFLSTLAQSTIQDIEQIWGETISSYDFEYIRQPEVGMVMAVARTGSEGEPFNLGEVSVTRCAVKLDSGENGFGYLSGRNKKHAATIALLDALSEKARNSNNTTEISRFQVLADQLNSIRRKQKKQRASEVQESRVNFYTMVRGED